MCIKKKTEERCTVKPLIQSVRQFLCLCMSMCVDAYVRVCSCAFRSAMTYREHLWVSLLPNIILFLLALMILWVVSQKKEKTTLVCIYIFVLCMYVFYVNNTPWNRNTQHPAIVLAFGPFFSIIPCPPFLSRISYNPSTLYNVSDSTGFYFMSTVWFRTTFPPFWK